MASIQADDSEFLITPDQVVRFVSTRARRTLDVTVDQEQRRAYVTSGLPVSAASNVYRDRDQFCQTAQAVFDADLSPESVISCLEWLEEWSRTNATGVVGNLPAKDFLDQVRAAWINGDPMREILEKTTEADTICKDTYGFQFPWLIHAASQQIKQMGNEDLFEILSSVAMLVELGLPSEQAAWIFLAGVRSRASATELAACGIDLGSSLSDIRRNLSVPDTVAALRDRVSERTKAWLDLHWADSVHESPPIPTFPRFTLKHFNEDTILVRNNDGSTYLCSPDGREKIAVELSDKWPFDRIADDYRFSFQKALDGQFDLKTRDPRLEAAS